MHSKRCVLVLFFVLSWGAAGSALSGGGDSGQIATVAFGSCLRQWQPQPVWNAVASLKPDAFVFLGDNVYTDVGPYKHRPEPQRIHDAYQQLQRSPDYRGFLASASKQGTRIYAVWDDHDYGSNDAGADYRFKLESKQKFLEFFDMERTTTEPDEPGIYRSDSLYIDDIRIQFLLLDTRSFRSPLKRAGPTPACPHVNTIPNNDQGVTVLGDRQWHWLEEQLRKPADLRFVATSIQLLPTEHCYEKWANFPAERKRLLDLLRATRANGVVVLSGDRHLGEISVLPEEAIGYPLYEVTSSGLNSAMGEKSRGVAEHNRLRATAENVLVNNFGSVQIQKGGRHITLRLQIRNEQGRILQQESVPLDALRHPRSAALDPGVLR